MKTYTPYTYLIGWSHLDRWYYGAEYSKNKRKIAHPSNLWRSYFTSSRIVKEYREKYGEPDVISVRKIFSTKEETKLWEHRVLVRMSSVASERWLNRSDGNNRFTYDGSKPYWMGKKNPSQSERMKGKEPWNKGKKTPTGKPAWNSGKKCPQIGDANRGKPKPKPEGFGEKIRQSRLGKPSPVKGRSYEDIYGPEKAAEMRAKRAESNRLRAQRKSESV